MLFLRCHQRNNEFFSQNPSNSHCTLCSLWLFRAKANRRGTLGKGCRCKDDQSNWGRKYFLHSDSHQLSVKLWSKKNGYQLEDKDKGVLYWVKLENLAFCERGTGPNTPTLHWLPPLIDFHPSPISYRGVSRWMYLQIWPSNSNGLSKNTRWRQRFTGCSPGRLPD